MGIQKLITNDRNSITDIAASNVRASDAIERTSVSRAGNGQIRLTGDYTGHADARYDIQIVAGGGNRITDAAFIGVGSGTITDLAVLGGATPQRWVFRLVNLGTDTETAGIEIEGVRIVAASAGAAGNQVFLSVDQSGVVSASSGFSLLEKLPKGTTEVTGPAYDWNTAIGKKDEVPENARRLLIGNSPTIYRQWKYYQDGRWRYRFLPEIDRDIPAGAEIFFVTGDRTVTIDSTAGGAIPESYSGIVTLYDLLVAIRDTPSVLVTVDGIISDSQGPDNLQAVLDLRLRTDAYMVETGGEGSEYATGFTGATIGANAKTEIITAECYANHSPLAAMGAEKWTLTGSVSGDLGNITTGDTYTHPDGRFSLSIPVKLPNGYDPNNATGDISYKISFIAREDNENKPEIVLAEMALGPNAESKTITWTYTKRPTGNCDTSMQQYAKLTDACLLGGAGGSEISDADYKIRIERLRAAQVNEGVWLYEVRRKDFRESLGELLEDIFKGTVQWPTWAASTAYNDFDVIEAGDYKFRAMGDGTSGATPPTWPTSIGATVTDGTVTWECIALKPLVWWDNLFALAKGITDGDTSDCSKPYDSTTFHDYILRHRNAILQAADAPFNAVPVAEKQNDASCWLASSDPYWWVPDDPLYLPAFTNREYHSVKGKAESPEPTYEFGFVIKVNETCIRLLKEGDQVVLKVGQSALPPTYQVGDKLFLSMVAASDRHLSGGVDGDDQLTWKVEGDVSGPASDYMMPKSAPPLYDNGQIQARIQPGGVPFELDDEFVFCVETGQYQWRKDGGAWSAAQPIADGPLADGLSVEFLTGVCPSFVDGDSASFTARQPSAPAKAMQPHDDGFAWTGSAVTITLTCSGDVDAVAVAMHDLPESAAINVSDGVSNWTMVRAGHLYVALLGATLASPTLTLSITGAPAEGGRIRWIWAGTPLSIDADANNRVRAFEWRRGDSAGANKLSVLRGHGIGWEIEWEGFVTRDELDSLSEAITWHKAMGNLPAAFVPSNESPESASVVLLPDQINAEDAWTWAKDSESLIRFAMQMPAWVSE